MAYHDIPMECIILNGEPHPDTIKSYQERGFVIVAVLPAKQFHPYAMPTDTILFAAKPINKEEYDQGMKNFEELEAVLNDSMGTNPNQ